MKTGICRKCGVEAPLKKVLTAYHHGGEQWKWVLEHYCKVAYQERKEKKKKQKLAEATKIIIDFEKNNRIPREWQIKIQKAMTDCGVFNSGSVALIPTDEEQKKDDFYNAVFEKTAKIVFEKWSKAYRFPRNLETIIKNIKKG